MFVTLAIALLAMSQVFAMSHSQMRETARFLSDRMAWELDMTPQQYDDCYEINYDFLFAINPSWTMCAGVICRPSICTIRSLTGVMTICVSS